MKIIFLDFDGVITSVDSGWSLDTNCMKLVKKICDETGARIVISSSWRCSNLKDTIKNITDRKRMQIKDNPFLMPELVVDVTPRLRIHNQEGKLCGSAPRGVEIQYWLLSHPEVENYIILDDDDDMMSYQETHFIMTSAYYGISQSDAEFAIKMLNGKVAQ